MLAVEPQNDPGAVHEVLPNGFYSSFWLFPSLSVIMMVHGHDCKKLTLLLIIQIKNKNTEHVNIGIANQWKFNLCYLSWFYIHLEVNFKNSQTLLVREHTVCEKGCFGPFFFYVSLLPGISDHVLSWSNRAISINAQENKHTTALTAAS